MAAEREKAGKTLASIDARVPARERKSSAQAAKAATRLRRYLTDAQRVTLARAYEAYFRPMAAENKGGRPKAGRDQKNLRANWS